MSPALTAASDEARALEHSLGDPRDPSSRISFHAMTRLDEDEAFPEEAVAALDAWGLGRFYVPVAHGGSLRSFETLTTLARAVARHDLSVAIAHAKTFLGVTPLWVAGSLAQRDRHGRAVAAGAKVSLGLTEEAHGGDLFSTETSAVESPAGYALTGEKWLINNATRGDAVTVLARTDPRGGPRGFSLLYVVKREVSGWSTLPKIPTHGIRGADISGLRFDRCVVPHDARIGAAGHGIELVMKSLQVTRTLVPTISLGALDTGLRQVLAFARGRRLGSVTVADIPHARRALAESFIELLALDALVRASARSVHVAPERLAVTSAVVKYLVPSRVDAALRRLAVILGARHYLRGTTFEKLQRDHGLVALFDGSTVVNLHSLAQELPRMASRGEGGTLSERLATIYDLRRPLPEFRPEALHVVARGDDEVPHVLAWASATIAALTDDAIDPVVRDALVTSLAAVTEARVVNLAAGVSRERPMAQPPEVFTAAERHARFHAAALCTAVWLQNRATFDAYFARGEWLALALAQLHGAPVTPAMSAWYERAFERLDALDRADCALALEPFAHTPEAAR
jgi:alkylation response protein AidB-like acyl-CoA dehydrogenase